MFVDSVGQVVVKGSARARRPGRTVSDHGLEDALVCALVMAHADGCTCRRCTRLAVAELGDQFAPELHDRRRRLDLRQHELHHHHVTDFDQLEQAETELAWEEIEP